MASCMLKPWAQHAHDIECYILVGRLPAFCEGLLSGSMLALGRVFCKIMCIKKVMDITNTFHMYIYNTCILCIAHKIVMLTYNERGQLLHKDNQRNNKHALAEYVVWYLQYNTVVSLYLALTCLVVCSKLQCLAIWVAEMLSGRAAGMLRRKLASVFASLQRDDACLHAKW